VGSEPYSTRLEWTKRIGAGVEDSEEIRSLECLDCEIYDAEERYF